MGVSMAISFMWVGVHVYRLVSVSVCVCVRGMWLSELNEGTFSSGQIKLPM